MASRKDRPSPSESATQFDVGTVKTGNDGNMYVISERNNGTQFWKKTNQTDLTNKTTSWKKHFFKENPDKVLGEEEEIKTKYGEPIIRIKGNLDELDKIKVPNVKTNKKQDSTQTVVTEDVTETTVTETQVKEVKEKVIKKSKKQLGEALIQKNNGTEYELFTFDEIDKEYNSKDVKQGREGISEAEKQAFVFYLEKLYQRKLKGGWEKYSKNLDDSATVIADNEENTRNVFAKKLMKQGVLCYDINEKEESQRYQPTFFYASGNIYQKHANFKRDRDFYVQTFGEEITLIQEEIINKVYKQIWKSRLTLDNPVIKNRLTINPNSKFANDYQIDRFILNGKTYKSMSIWTSQAGGKEKKDIAKEYGRQSMEQSYSKYNLTDGFILWLKTAGDVIKAKENGVIYRNGMNYSLIYKIYINNGTKQGVYSKDMTDEVWLNKKGYAQENGQRLFAQFLEFGVTNKERKLIEYEWNKEFNGSLDYDVNRVPIGFQFAKRYNGIFPIDIRKEKRRALAFNMLRGSSMLAYGVGLGKTWCAIFTVAQNMQMGICKRPLIVVPNQVYPQFIKEIQGIIPQYKLNTLYNCRGYFLELAQNIEDNTISVMTYEGLTEMGFTDNMDLAFMGRITNILSQGNEHITERQREKLKEKYDEFIGRGKREAKLFMDNPNVNFDYIVCDEAHNFKKVFTQVKGEASDEQPDGTRITYVKTEYQISSGNQSNMAIKLFFLTQYIQMQSVTGNCLLLTATPFTNSPLEVFSIIALINYDYLNDSGLGSIKDFFDNYANIKTQTVINTQLQAVRKQVFVGWQNVVSLQNIIFKFIDKPTKEEEQASVPNRPNKIVLPLRSKMVDEIEISIPEKNRVSTTLQMTDIQKVLMDELQTYAEGNMTYAELIAEHRHNTTTCGKLVAKKKKKKDIDSEDEEEAVIELADEVSDDKVKDKGAGVRALQCLTYARQLALSPYLYRYSGIKVEPTAQEYVETSPKFNYVMKCIRSVREHHLETDTKISGQVMYMNIGTDCFKYLQDYLVDNVGFAWHEIGIISGSEARIGRKKMSKDQVQDGFLGRKYNIKKQGFEPIPDSQRVKVLIGSESIREGMNLQDYSSTLYNLYIDFNPTDQEQLVGRIWRQKNAFKNVRIVIPLVENSMDIFMFQKLQEKTKRINEIWARTGLNEIDTTEFNPEELKFELITNPITLAQLSVEEEKRDIDDKIDEVNYEWSSLNKINDIYSEGHSFYKDHSRSGFGGQKDFWYYFRIAKIYEWLETMRPDLVPKPLLKNDLDWWDIQNHRGSEFSPSNEANGYTIPSNILNYSPEKLFELVVEMKKGNLINYPLGYKDGFNDVEPEFPRFKIGDEVEFDTRRGRKKGKIVYECDSMLLPENCEYDIQVGKDEENVSENINATDSNITLIVKEDKSKKPKKKREYKPFKIGSKEFKDNIYKIGFYQYKAEQNELEGEFYKYNERERRKETYGDKGYIDDYQSLLSIISNLLQLNGEYNYINDGEYFPNKNNNADFIQLKKLEKWINNATIGDFWDRLQEKYGNEEKGYTNRRGDDEGGYGGGVIWSPEYPSMLKKIERAEEEFLKPKGINNKVELAQALEKLKLQIGELEDKKDDLTDEQYIKEKALEIQAEKDRQLMEGIRKASTPQQRLEEFESPTPDYLGNELLDFVNMPEKDKQEVEVKEDKKEEEKSKPNFIQKRIMGLEMVLEDMKESKEKSLLKKRVMALNLTLE